ncbi:MaoC family dehydratase N-terminal domain-containing protein [Schlegelella sp. ID0723]|uniref:MaoC family dehydratase N-terminal domain-containing protein n=2 Tax=Piscinibacter koreensis TaxID=2742824 RepID=A0A7Y6NN26_9BURK|nr:MaoC/PaaZ C-terminal domain-containing protein [Schlegelella koreensis]NUZ06131.1 MaoC family dehydratase N-terminal domain-containing protein [Schlegelella koreensis]
MEYEKTRAWTSPDVRHAYTAKDTILYALGLGIGADPLDPVQLRFTYERNLVAMPTMAAVLASPGFWMRDRPELGIDYTKLVHGEQRVTLHRPLAPEGTLIGRSRVVGIADKGAGKGALMHVEKTLSDEASGALVATSEQVLFLRGDGGFANVGGGDAPAPALPATPERAPDVELDLPTRPDAALLYRLSGDVNPLHVDPAFAARAGFARPILHGLATYGIAGWGLVRAFCDGDPARLTSIAARLSAPVYPGETLRLEAWREGGEVAFRCRVVERDVVVLSHGRARC